MKPHLWIRRKDPISPFEIAFRLAARIIPHAFFPTYLSLANLDRRHRAVLHLAGPDPRCLVPASGGTRRLYGAVLGSTIFMVARNQPSDINPQYWYFWIGLLLMSLVLFLPCGILADFETRNLKRSFGSLVVAEDISLKLKGRGTR